MNTMNDWQAQTCLIASWLDSSSSSLHYSSNELQATNSFVNYQNEFQTINLNENNASDSFSFDDLLLDNIDLTCAIEMNSSIDANQLSDDQQHQLNLNAFDLSDTKLFDFINEIELFETQSNSLEDSNCLVSSPSVTSSNELSDSAFDSFSSSSSPSSDSDSGSLSPPSVTSLDQSNKIKMIRTNNGGHINKKESNKAAASRYRSKKSKEKDQLFVECELYEQKNSEMKQKISDIESEIQSIRSLLVQALLVKDTSLTKLSSCGLLA